MNQRSYIIMKHHTLKTLCVGALFALALSQASAQQLTLRADNIDEILKAMTLEEKANLLIGNQHTGVTDGKTSATEGDGSMIGSTDDYVRGAAGTTCAIPRLGIPATVLTDGPAGVRISPTRPGDSHTYYATGFPVGTELASTWNTELVESVGQSIGEEVLEYGCDVLLAPGMNLHRSPFCGRNFEYYSEDPLVTGKMAAAYVRGVQSKGVGTSVKHFVANSQETNRTGVNEVVSQRALRELYLKGFEIAVKEGHPWTVMSSYNKLNGPFTQENGELLTTVLRDEWGFDGIVMTDWIGQRHTDAQVRAGNDLMEPGEMAQVREIVEKVKSGELAEADVDRNVRRILQYIVKTPRFRGYAYSNEPDLKAHAEVTRQSATEGMVLLKNDGDALPLKDVKRIALFGITSYDFIAGGTGSGDVNKPYIVDLMQGLTGAGLEVNEGLKNTYVAYKQYQDNLGQVERDPLFPWWSKPVYPEMKLSKLAISKQVAEADIAIYTIGRQAGEGADRVLHDDFLLKDSERRILTDICEAFHAAGKKVVVILNMGGVIETASWKDLPDAILLAWQPGQEGGNSVADVLTGKQNPSGKLTMTFPRVAQDHPSSFHFPIDAKRKTRNPWIEQDPEDEFFDYTLHKEGINIGYRYFNTVGKEVSYPFGYGLSYTTFAYSKPTVKAGKDGFTASVTVTNRGKVAGKEVVEVYVSAPKGKLEKPANELKAFGKTRLLQPGESQTLTFSVSNYELASYDEARHSWVSDKGTYTVKFAASVEDVRGTGTYSLAKEFVQEAHDVLNPDREL
jgi:beta-glucosidase